MDDLTRKAMRCKLLSEQTEEYAKTVRQALKRPRNTYIEDRYQYGLATKHRLKKLWRVEAHKRERLQRALSDLLEAIEHQDVRTLNPDVERAFGRAHLALGQPEQA